MVTPAPGEIVLVRFPFSDLSQTKLRPAACVGQGGQQDWILCQITSKPYGDPNAVNLDSKDFQSGGLHKKSYVRPGKIFTAHDSLIVGSAGILNGAARERVIDAVIALLQGGR